MEIPNMDELLREKPLDNIGRGRHSRTTYPE